MIRAGPLGRNGRIAQLAEQLTLNQRVLGSSPSASTIFFNELDGFFEPFQPSYWPKGFTKVS